MNLSPFEIEVIKILLKDKLKAEDIKTLISKCSVINYEFTGAGYFP